jgi:hypothetical protein
MDQTLPAGELEIRLSRLGRAAYQGQTATELQELH